MRGHTRRVIDAGFSNASSMALLKRRLFTGGGVGSVAPLDVPLVACTVKEVEMAGELIKFMGMTMSDQYSTWPDILTEHL